MPGKQALHIPDPPGPSATGTGEAEAGGTLAERLFSQLMEAILQGEIPLGSKISEPILAQRYGVSRGPLREALHRLQERHLLTRSTNQGARVVEATPEMLSSIFMIREVLEGLAAREAALRMSTAELAGLREVVGQHEAELANLHPGERSALGRADGDFHARIAQGSANPILIRLLCDEFHPLLRLYRSRKTSQQLRARALLEHQRILAALEDRDSLLAELLMRRHIAAAMQRRSDALSGED